MRVSELFVKCLENEGVEYIFGVPGEENIDFLDALKESNIEFITTRHETGAAFMAGIYGKLTGKPGVCLATLGPGATNLVTGVAEANMDLTPLIAITGQAGLERQHKQSHQYYDLISMFKPITKWNTSIRDKDIVPEVVRKAFQQAVSEKPGAVHIELPEDIAELEVEGQPLATRSNELFTQAVDGTIAEAASVINDAENPIVLVGNGVTRMNASEPLKNFIEKINAPFTSTFMGKGALSYEHPQNLQTVGLQDRDHIVCGINNADLIITIGFDFTEYSPSAWNPDGAKPVIHIDTQAAEVDACYPVKVGVIGDLVENLNRLTEKVNAREQMDAIFEKLRTEIMEDLSEHDEDKSYPMKPQKIAADLRAVLDEDAILLSDVGAHKMWLARYFNCIKPNTCLISNGFASMGIAMPGAIGAKLAFPDKKVVAVAGDGGFLMTVQELETMVRLKLPIVVIVWTDNRYGLIEWKQLNEFDRSSSITFDNPDLIQLAKAFGAEGMKVLRTEEFKPILERAFELDKPVIIDCPVDHKENIRLTERLGNIICSN